MDFFAAHADSYPWLILIGLAIFPRITMLFVGGPFAWFHWVGWLVAPHLTVAILATLRYWETNPWLVVIAWIFALGGTGGEAGAARRRRRRRRRDDDDD